MQRIERVIQMDGYAVDARGNIWGVNDPELMDNLPKGVMGFNGRASTPNYKLLGSNVVERTEEEKAKDPYSDEPEQNPVQGLQVAVAQLDAMVVELAYENALMGLGMTL